VRKLQSDFDELKKPQSSGRWKRALIRGYGYVVGTVITVGSGGLLAPTAVDLVTATEFAAAAQRDGPR
jgi:hypothetical protein